MAVDLEPVASGGPVVGNEQGSAERVDPWKAMPNCPGCNGQCYDDEVTELYLGSMWHDECANRHLNGY